MNDTGQTKVNSSVVMNVDNECMTSETNKMNDSSQTDKPQVPANGIAEHLGSTKGQTNARGMFLRDEESLSNETVSIHVGLTEQKSLTLSQTHANITQQQDSSSDLADEGTDPEPPVTQCLPSWRPKPAACNIYRKSSANARNNGKTASYSQAVAGHSEDGSEAGASGHDTLTSTLDWIRCGASIVSSYLNWKRDGCKYSFSLPQFRDPAKLRQINSCSELGRTRHRLPPSQRTHLRHSENVHSHDVGMHDELCERSENDNCTGNSYISEDSGLHRGLDDTNRIISQVSPLQKQGLHESKYSSSAKTKSIGTAATSEKQLESWDLRERSIGSVDLRDQNVSKTSLDGSALPSSNLLLPHNTYSADIHKSNHSISTGPTNPFLTVSSDNMLTTSHLNGDILYIQSDQPVQNSKIPNNQESCIFHHFSTVDELSLDSVSCPTLQATEDNNKFQECDMVSIALDSEESRNDDADTIECNTPSPCSSTGGDDHSSSSSEVMQSAMGQSASACFCWLGNPRRREDGQSKSYCRERNARASGKTSSAKHQKQADSFFLGEYQDTHCLESTNRDQESQVFIVPDCDYKARTFIKGNEIAKHLCESPGGHENINPFEAPELMSTHQLLCTQSAKNVDFLGKTAANNVSGSCPASADGSVTLPAGLNTKHAICVCCNDSSCISHIPTTHSSTQNTNKNVCSTDNSKTEKPKPYSSCDINMCNRDNPYLTVDCLEENATFSKPPKSKEIGEANGICQCLPIAVPLLESPSTRPVNFSSHFASEQANSPQVSISDSFNSVLRDLTNLTKPETLTADSRQGTSSTGEWEKSHNMDSRQKKKRTKRTLPHAGQKVALTTSMEESDSDKTCKGNDRRTAGICSRLQNRKYRSLQSSNSQSSASSPGQSRSNTQFDAQNFVQRVKERLQSVRSLATSRQASHLSPSGQNLPLQTSHEAFRSVDSSLLGSVPSKSNVPSNVKSIMCSPNQPPSTDRATKSPVRFNNWNNSSSRKVRASSFGAQSALQQFTEDPICNITNLWHVGESERGNGLQNMDSAHASFRMEHEIGAKYRCWSTWSCGDLADDKKGAKKLKASSCPEDDILFPDLSSCGLPHQNDMLRLKPNHTWPSQLYRCISSSSSSSSSVSTLFSQVDLEQSSDSESQGYNMCNYMNDRPFDGEDCCSDESETLAASLKVLLAGSTADVMETEKNDVAENRIRLPVTDTGLQSERESGLSTLYRELYHGEVEIDSDEEWKFLATVVNIDFDDADWGASTAKDRSKSGQFQWNTEQSNSSGASSDDQERDMLGSGITGRSAFIVHRQLTEPDKKWSSKELPGSLQPKSEHHSPGGNDLEDGWFDSPGKTSSRKEPTSEQWHSTKYQMPRQADMPCDTHSSSYLVQEENSRTFLPFRQSEQDVADHSNWLSMTCPSLTGTETVWPGTSPISTSVRQKARRGNNKSELCSDEEEEDNVANGNSTDENYEGDTELDCDCGGCDVTLHGDWMQVTRLSLDENNSVSSSSGIPVQSSLRGAEGILSEEHNAASSSSIPMLPNLPRNQSWTDFPRQLTDDGNIGGASGRQRRSRGRDFQRQSSEDESLMRNSERQSMREVHPGLVLTGNVLEDVDLLGTFLSSHWEELSYHMSIVDRFIEAFAACLSDAPRLTEEELERLTSFPASAIEEGETCAICLSNIQFQEMVIRLPTCSHLFHTTCITKWLSTSRSCPVCRTVVQVQSTLSSSELNLEQNLKDFSK